jgi:hypothetical protein
MTLVKSVTLLLSSTSDAAATITFYSEVTFLTLAIGLLLKKVSSLLSS